MDARSRTMGVKDAARLLKVTTKYVYDLIYNGRLPARKHNRSWRISAAAVQARMRPR
jgi:excisionase family DNA binding protein